MKLYAKTTTERASKGQGGNKWLDVQILAENVEGIPTRQNLYELHLEIDEDNFLLGSLFDYSTGERTILLKGEKKKDVCDICGDNNAIIENHKGQITCEACETKRAIQEQ